jgi:hypothetical protein
MDDGIGFLKEAFDRFQNEPLALFAKKGWSHNRSLIFASIFPPIASAQRFIMNDGFALDGSEPISGSKLRNRPETGFISRINHPSRVHLGRVAHSSLAGPSKLGFGENAMELEVCRTNLPYSCSTLPGCNQWSSLSSFQLRRALLAFGTEPSDIDCPH